RLPPSRLSSQARAQQELRPPVLSRQQLFEFGVELAGIDAAVDDAAVFANEDHGGQREHAEVGGERTVEAALLIELWPGELFAADVVHCGLRIGIEVHADSRKAVFAVLGNQ